MIIERNLAAYLVYAEDPVLRALEKITANQARIIFLVDSHGHLEGSLSDGDFRRWVSHARPASTSTAPRREAAQHRGPRRPADQHHARPRSRTLFGAGHRPRAAGRRARPPRRRRDQPRQRAPDRPLPGRPRQRRPGDQRDRHQPPGLGRLRQGARRPVGRGRRRRREVPAARHGRALPPGRRPAAAARTSARSTPSTCSRSSTSTADQLFEVFDHCARRRRRGDVHGLGPAQRRPPRGVRHPGASRSPPPT